MAAQPQYVVEPPDISHIVTEDDEPLESWYHAMAARLLVSSLRHSWEGRGDGEPFVVDGNVGIFYGLHTPPVVPDVLVSCGVTLAEDLGERRNRSYFVWEFGKSPDVVVEIVSNKKGGEGERKPDIYAAAGVPWYVIHDPYDQLGEGPLRLLELQGRSYVERDDLRIPPLKLGVTLWEGVYEETERSWIRWTDTDGRVLPTPGEAAGAADERAAEADERAAEAEAKLAALQARMAELGLEPEGG